MVNAAEAKRIAGKVSLSLEIDRSRQRTFLRRNLAATLDLHEQHLRAANASGDNISTDGMQSESSDNLTWKFPTKEMLERLVRKQKAVLRVHVKAIKPCAKASAKPFVESDNPRKKAKLLEIPIQLELKISEVQAQKQRLVRCDVQSAQIKAFQDEDGKVYLDVEMLKPFLIEIDQLFVTLERGHHWKRTIALAYSAQISVTFLDDDDVGILLPKLFVKPGLGDFSGQAPLVVAKWRHLPKCPPSGHVIPLTGTFANEKYKSDYGLEVDMAWKTSKHTPLEEYNHALRASQNNQLPSPISEPRDREESVRVIYVFRDDYASKSLILAGYLCPLCNRRDLRTHERLHLHLVTEHDYFKFTMHKNERRLECEIAVEVTFEVELADRFDSRMSGKSLEKSEMRWVAPQQPFDITKYLEGDDGWITSGLDQKRKVRAPKTNTVATQTVGRRNPEDIADLPVMNRTRYRVPVAPEGLAYFRTVGKRPLSEGEMISESDDDIDEGWLKVKRHRATNDSGIPETAREFMKKFDDYIQDEQLSGDRYAGDALVRFARLHRRWLSKPRRAEEFKCKLSELRNDRIISGTVFNYCMKLIPSLDEAIEDDMYEAADTIVGPNTPVVVNGVGSRGQNDQMSKKVLNAILKLSPWRGHESAGVRRAMGFGRRSTQSSSEQLAAFESEGSHVAPRCSTGSPRAPSARRERGSSLHNGVPDGDGEAASRRDGDGDTEMVYAHDLPLHLSNANGSQAVTNNLDSEEPGRCICGKVVDALRTAVSCANHVSCCFVIRPNEPC